MNDEQKQAYEQFQNVNFNSLADWFFSLSGAQTSIAATVLAVAIAAPLNYYQQQAIGNLLNLLGQVILNYSTQQRIALETKSLKTPLSEEEQYYVYGMLPLTTPIASQEVEMLRLEVARLMEEVNKLKR